MGTVISPQHLQRIESMMKRTRGTIVAGGHRMIGKSDLDGFDFIQGSFFPPTVVTEISSKDELWKEEIFGPVVVVRRFSVRSSLHEESQALIPLFSQNETEAVSLANDSKYGLGAGIWTSDLSRAHRVAAEIEAGLCWVNTHHRNDPSSPWYAYKSSEIFAVLKILQGRYEGEWDWKGEWTGSIRSLCADLLAHISVMN
jgi:acyl-CoA reductase-like NAD-dependent aldehyde dehydrogenase